MDAGEILYWLVGTFGIVGLGIAFMLVVGPFLMAGAAFENFMESEAKRLKKKEQEQAWLKRKEREAAAYGGSGREDDYNGPRDGRGFWVTGGSYDPQTYYAKTNGYSREERNYIHDAYGDWDTYEANRPD